MATLGYTTTPSHFQFGEGFNIGDQIGLAATMPSPGGVITVLHAFAQSFNGTNTMTLVVWDASGNVLASGTASAASSPSSGAWVTTTLGTPLFVASSATIYIGFANPNNTSGNSGFVAEYDQAGGTTKWNQQSSAPGNLLTGTNATNLTNTNIGAYADYTPAGMYVRRSGVWTAAPVYVRRSGAWVQATVYVRRSGVWVAAG